MCHSNSADVYLMLLAEVIPALVVSMVPQWPHKISGRHLKTVKLSQILFGRFCNVLRNGTSINQALFWTLSTEVAMSSLSSVGEKGTTDAFCCCYWNRCTINGQYWKFQLAAKSPKCTWLFFVCISYNIFNEFLQKTRTHARTQTAHTSHTIYRFAIWNKSMLNVKSKCENVNRKVIRNS